MRKFAAALTAYLMLNVVLACLAGAVDFGDVPKDHWAREERLEIIRLANEVRVRNGVKECVVSEALMDAAQKFAETMPQDHDISLEYQLRAESGCNHGVGCNLYRATNVKLSAMPISAVYAWEHSRGHYVAMVNAASDSMGIGLYHDEAENTWYSVMFIGDCQKAGNVFGNSHP